MKDLVLNELSLHDFNSSIINIENIFCIFIQTILEGVNSNQTKRSLINSEVLSTYRIDGKHTFIQLISNDTISRDLLRYFYTISTKTSLKQLLDSKNDFLSHEYKYNNKQANGLGIAHYFNFLPISFCTNIQWDNFKIILEKLSLDADETIITPITIYHVSTPSHFLNISEDKVVCICNNIKCCLEIWTHKNIIFKDLVFCDSVKDNLSKLSNNYLDNIMRLLQCLDTYSKHWLSGPFSLQHIDCDCSPETEQTLNMYGNYRRFVLPDGTAHVFNYHAKSGDIRIYFDPYNPPKTITIGYIGLHLPTVRF
ncbi:MAG: hypothetical protein ACOY4F_04220 [Thermodesulfobacteriota bacterium]